MKNILSELTLIFEELKIPIETGIMNGRPLDTYAVLIPMSERFEVFADNKPQIETQEVRISLFTRENYIKIKNQLVRSLIRAGFTILERQYVDYENDTKYHHYAIDVEKEYFYESGCERHDNIDD